MSFGGSVGDIVTVGQLAWTVYKGCKDAPEGFKNLSQEVLSLHAVLKEVEECLTSKSLMPSKQFRLETVTQGCSKVLEDLQDLVDRYRSLDTQSRRTWDRVKFASENTAELRSRLTSNTVLLTAYLSTCQSVVEKRLNDFLRDFQTGRHDGSIISTDTVRTIISTKTTLSISLEDQETWRIIRKELEDLGISIAAFDANKTFIMDWFKTAVDNGSFDEQAPYESLSNTSEIAASGDGLSNLANIDHANSSASDLDESYRGTLSNTTHNEDNNSRLPVVTALENANSVSTSDKEYISQIRPMLLPRALPQRRLQKPTALVVLFAQHKRKLREAVRRNDQIKLQQLLDRGCDANMKFDDGWVPLIDAVKLGRNTVAELLLKSGANACVVDKHRDSVLLHAIRNNWEHIVRLLLDYGANVNNKNLNHDTSLHLAVSQHRTTIVQLLLDRGASTHIQNNYNGNTALHEALIMKHNELALLLLNHGAAVSIKNNTNHTALDLLLSSRDKRLIQQLLKNRKNGIDVHEMSTENHSYLLLEALRLDEFEFAQLLLMNGAVVRVEHLTELLRREGNTIANENLQLLLNHCEDINLMNGLYKTALYCAVESGKNEAVKLLLQHGADVGLYYAVPQYRPNYTDLKSFQLYQYQFSWAPLESILELAFAIGNSDAVQLLLETGMNVKNKDKCLQAAILASDSDTVQLLLESGADPNIISQQPGGLGQGQYNVHANNHCYDYGRRDNYESIGSIHRAAYKGDVRIMQLLLDSGADIDMKTWKNSWAASWTALHCAVSSEQLPIVQLLLEKGANTCLWDDQGRTPYDLALHIADSFRMKSRSSSPLNNIDGDIFQSLYAKMGRILTLLRKDGAQTFDEIIADSGGEIFL